MFIHPLLVPPPKKVRHHRLAARRKSGKERPPVTHRPAVDLGNCRRLGRSQAVRAVRARTAAGTSLAGVNSHLRGSSIKPVLEPVDRIAFRHHLPGDQRHFSRRHRSLAERFLIPHRADRETRLIQPGCVGHDAVEVIREALGSIKPLASAVGAGVPVGAGNRLP